ncbi:hypothetical protein J5N97_028098 [Dioscorea zingiberensis]|uniref:Uncharacterized protein n=1 Tax=Dioscorea zingiberensis TaxID=325984 RepID=A0A9D5BY12_9LILI|nr:hypothetical protein J5N97_028098 [Dioscorea zingiberensis]
MGYSVERRLLRRQARVQEYKFVAANARKRLMVVAGYPPVLIKSIKNSLEPRLEFLVEVMGRGIGEVVGYPEFFGHGLNKSLEFRQKLLMKRNIHCSLSEMLDCNKKRFIVKFGIC